MDARSVCQTKLRPVNHYADLIAEINVETFEATKAGQIQFSHPEGTHDGQLWALALAIYATRHKLHARRLRSTQ